MSQAGGEPRLSVVVVSWNGPESLHRCLTSLGRQTLQEGLEILVVSHEDSGRPWPEAQQRQFSTVSWISAPVSYNVAEMRSVGIVRSRAGIVALLEDDCVVPETWCEALLKAHSSPHAAIGGAVEPAGYARSLDWAVYFCEFGAFMQPLTEEDARALPGTNVSYKRAVLAALHAPPEAGDRSATRGFYETFVHQGLRRAGWRLKLDPELVVYNTHCWTVYAALRSRYHHARGFAGLRVAGRSAGARAVYLGLAVVLPIIQVGRIARHVVGRRRLRMQAARALPWITLCAASWSVGEFVGYLLGPGESLGQWH